jgi:hypothetical protein
MKNSIRNWSLALVALCCLIPASFADRDRDHHHGCDNGRSHGDCQQVPEGGSTAIYLLGAGLTCVGAMFLRSKSQSKTAQSLQS